MTESVLAKVPEVALRFPRLYTLPSGSVTTSALDLAVKWIWSAPNHGRCSAIFTSLPGRLRRFRGYGGLLASEARID